ncbi:MAG: hypothetical protein WBO58_13050 [Gammaproteobacteria bacterium]
MKPTTENIQRNWENATWEGSRRAMIRTSLRLSARERLQALENLHKTSQRLASLKLKKHT